MELWGRIESSLIEWMKFSIGIALVWLWEEYILQNNPVTKIKEININKILQSYLLFEKFLSCIEGLDEFVFLNSNFFLSNRLRSIIACFDRKASTLIRHVRLWSIIVSVRQRFNYFSYFKEKTSRELERVFIIKKST